MSSNIDVNVDDSTENAVELTLPKEGNNLKADVFYTELSIPTIDTLSTVSLNPSSSMSTTAHSTTSFLQRSPQLASVDSSNCCSTPKNQPTSWEQVKISPSTLISFSDATAAMKNDKIMNCKFYKNNGQVVKRCTHYLYGKKYKSTFSTRDRKKSIKTLINKEKGNLQRLADAALSNPLNDVSLREDSLEGFLRMAVTLQFFFGEKFEQVFIEVFRKKNEEIIRKFGGFHGAMCARFQRPKSCACYQAGICMFFSLVMRFYKNVTLVNDNYIVEIGQLVRRNVLTTDEKIEDRVIRNKGYGSAEFDMAITKQEDIYKEENAEFWNIQFIKNMSSNYIEYNCKNHGPGLIYGFKVGTGFRKAAESTGNRNGFWEFTGETCDSNGKFVEVPGTVTEALKDYEASQREVVENERAQAQKYQTECRSEMYATFGINSADSTSTNQVPEEEKIDATPGGSSYHSLVLVGGIVRNNHVKVRRLYLCINSWSSMPLVLLSKEYLIACGAKVLFRTAAPDAESVLKILQNDNHLVDCCPPPDAGIGDNRGDTARISGMLSQIGLYDKHKEYKKIPYRHNRMKALGRK